MKTGSTILFLSLSLALSPISFCQGAKNKKDKESYIALAKENVNLFVERCWEVPIDIPFKSILYIYNTNKCSHDTSLAFYNVIYQGSAYIIDTVDVYTFKHVYKELINMSKYQKDSLYLATVHNDSVLTAAIDILREEYVNKEIREAEKHGVYITDCGLFDVSEYTDGTGYSFNVFNPENKKTIKYITLKVVAYNPVKDKVYSSKFNSYIVTLKGVGPIKPGEGGTYAWDYVWFSDLPETSKILSITIQYMDNSVKTITDASKVILSDEAKKAYNLE